MILILFYFISFVYTKNYCVEKIETANNQIIQDPGTNCNIHVFSNFEASSNIFTNEHLVDINNNNKFNLTNVRHVNQNIQKGLKVDNLLFINETSNLLIKPKGPILNISIKEGNKGPDFRIEIDTFLKLNVLNIHETRINVSKIYVTGFGELNINDYPIDKIYANSTAIKVIKGVYTICNSKDGNSICSYSSAEQYKHLDNCHGFRKDFDPNSKIVVFLDSFTSNIDAYIHFLKGQKIHFIRKSSGSHILEEKKQNKLRLLSSNEITFKSDSTTLVSGIDGSALLNSFDSNLFVVNFDGNLTIKQEGAINSDKNVNIVTIHPMNEEATIIVDDSIDIEKLKLNIETDENKKCIVKLINNQKVSNDEIINKLFEMNKNNVIFTIKENVNKKPNSSKKSLSAGAISGMVIGVLAAVAIIVVIVILCAFKKKKKSQNNAEENHDSDYSVGL